MIIPEFREIYKKVRVEAHSRVFDGKKVEILGHIRTVCELRDLESNEILAFGISKVSLTARYNATLGKITAFGYACRFLFLKNSNLDEPIIEDNTDVEVEYSDQPRNSDKRIDTEIP